VVNSENAIIENEMNITVVFPDGDMPQPTNGGFGTQDKFRNFLMEHDNGKWTSMVQSKPSTERIQDHDDHVVAQAFPLQFPFGYSGMPGDKAYEKLISVHGKKPFLQRNRLDVLRKLLQHRKSCFHSPEFNLIVENMIMKQTIYASAQLNCNIKGGHNGISMAEKFGTITAKQVQDAIQGNRRNDPKIYSHKPEYQFLQSITATCRSLPHTNEAAMENRKMYFSFLMTFGLPCIFLTVTPDDNRSFRIILYSMKGKNGFGMKPDDLSDDDILLDMKFRQESRLNYPGLCAEEYSRIMDLVIKHVFGWNIETNRKEQTIGLFGDVIAWCLATEEQGRKTLHGHYLVFLKDWNIILEALQKQGKQTNVDVPTITQAKMTTKALHRHVCSARLFQDFAHPTGLFRSTPVFTHKCIQDKPKCSRFTVDPSTDQELRDMRHKRKCQEFEGKVATCNACNTIFTVNDIVSLALATHLGKTFVQYKDNTRRLDARVYEMGMEMDWTESTPEEQALRYFAANALVNIHSVTHANRCFKKGSECYANLPEPECHGVQIEYNIDPDIWSDWMGHKHKRYMFRIYPDRQAEDAFMNSHNPTLTQLLCCNTNVMVAMNGASVFYVTGYNAKSNQKEEKAAFEVISEVVVKHLEKQVCQQYTALHFMYFTIIIY
jgi:Helitron helicase-like domain at N-terminus